MNINVKNGTLKNLAAGGGNGGTVKNVNLSFGDGAHVSGTTFAGGQGNVEGAAKTLIDGGTFGGVFVAGAFSNRIDTAVGSVEITIDGGSFDGNVYGGSQVRYAAGRTNTVGSISVNLNDVDSVKTGFSIFAGGMAAGSDASKSANAYEVTGDISVNVTGGNWCNNVASGGRGLFGGIFAGDSGTTKTGVKAEVAGSVNIIIDGGCLGNVYGGGWAQKGGVSVVDNVSITVNGGEIVNVFGGGSHSTTSGGTTLVSNGVNITVEGGNIAGSIYARGQLTGDTVNGDATVTFTSRANSEYSCGVYGYSMEEAILANSGDSYLVFDGYKGTLTDSIGGFYAIRFQGDAMVCFTADRKSTLPLHPTYGPIDPAAVATVQNGVWDFDLSARGAAFASDAVLTWSGDMSANEVTLHFADDAGAVDSWTIATGLADVADCYAIDIAGAGITAELGVAITGTGTDYDNKWAVVFEDNTLKFAKITA